MAIPAKNPKFQFYRRQLPKTCIGFATEEGRVIFKEAMNAGHMTCFFKLSAQFRTQDEPAYCGLTSLVMALNALEIDPGRVWKGAWRWYHEDMLDCCVPLAVIKERGMNWEQFICLAKCNNLAVEELHAVEFKSLEELRNLVKQKVQVDNQVLIVSYSRAVLKQTGSGHFSPIAGYHEGKDLVLILDTARFKYPPHWVSLSSLFEAMQNIDPDTGLSRGLVILSRSEVYVGTLLYRPSCSFVVNSHKGALPDQVMNFFEKWNSFLNDQDGSQKDTSKARRDLIQQFVHCVVSCLQGVSLLCLVMQSKTSGHCESLCCTMKCTNASADEVKEINYVYVSLIKELESLRTFDLVKEALSSLTVEERVQITSLISCSDLNKEHLTKPDCCLKKENKEVKCSKDSQDSIVSLTITPENILTVIFLAWPIQACSNSTRGSRRDFIAALVEEDLLDPSKRTIKQEILSLQYKFVEALNYHLNDTNKSLCPHSIFS